MSPLPPPRLAAAFWVALSAAVLLWLPLTILPILDGLLFAAPARDILRDLALLAWAAVLPALGLALLASLTRRLLAGRANADEIAWSLLLLPLALIVLRQTARLFWQWLRVVSNAQIEMPGSLKLALLAACLAGLLALVWRRGWAATLGRPIRPLLELRPLTALLMLVAAIGIALHPPRFVPMDTRAPTGAAPAAGSDLLLITLDAVAAQDADLCNPASATMPRLAAFARQASCFERFYTASNFTTATTSTIESGLLPWTHHATQPDATMAEGTRAHTLAARLHAAGWRTHHITDNLLASPRHRGSFEGYDSARLADIGLASQLYRGLAARLPDTTLPRLLATSLAFLSASDAWRHPEASPYRPEAVHGGLEQLMEQERALGRRQFFWAHSLPPHAPYLPPPGTRHRLLPAGELERLEDLLPDNIDYPPAQQPLVDKHRLRYRELMMAADASVGDLLDRLERDGRLKNTVVVISTDHGESFEQGFFGHAGSRLHEALIRGPLLIRLPGQTQGRVIPQAVSQADLAPTLLDLAGLAPLPAAEGRSLRPLLEGGSLPEAPVFAMAMERQSRYQPLRQGHYAVVDGQDKLVLDLERGTSRFFRLDRDPGERQDLSAAEPERARALRQLLDAGLARAEGRRGQELGR